MNDDFKAPLPVDLRKYIDDDESVLWHGRPAQGLHFTVKDFFQIPLIAAFFVGSSFMELKGHFEIMGGNIFFAFSLYMIFARFFYEPYRRGNTILAVTNKRLLIVTKTYSETCDSLLIRDIKQITLKFEGSAGSGTIVFGNPNPRAKEVQVPSFEGIDEVKRVYDLIRKTQNPAIP
jgi:hypothetical protein